MTVFLTFSSGRTRGKQFFDATSDDADGGWWPGRRPRGRHRPCVQFDPRLCQDVPVEIDFLVLYCEGDRAVKSLLVDRASTLLEARLEQGAGDPVLSSEEAL